MASSYSKRLFDSLDKEAPSPRPPQRRKLKSTSSTTTSTVANLGLVPDLTPAQTRQWKQHSHTTRYTGPDLISPLSDELLLRVLSFLPLKQLLGVSLVSHRFYALACDSQLWRSLYYHRFVLPRARLIPGFGADADGSHHRNLFGRGLPDKLQRAVGFEGRRVGPFSDDEQEDPLLYYAPEEDKPNGAINWKRQYTIRSNWAKGKCKAAELVLGGGQGAYDVGEYGRGRRRRSKMLIKTVGGIAISADKQSGLRAWDLRDRKLLGRAGFVDNQNDEEVAHSAAPSCMAIDGSKLEDGILDIGLGFTDGSFGVWRLFTKDGRLKRRYRHEKSSNGELIEMAYSHPYLITATQAVLVSLYTFGTSTSSANDRTTTLPPPYLLTSLDSHTGEAPLSFSIRKTTSTVIASIAYTVETHVGWSFGVQDLHISPSAEESPTSTPEVTTTPIAHTLPLHLFRRPVDWIEDGFSRASISRCRVPAELSVYKPPFMPPMTNRSRILDPGRVSHYFSFYSDECGPKALCYNHPYLVVTLPDNTLSHYLARSDPSSLTITPGHRLWGHTSGISRAQVNSRGKAVSVCTRGDEMRVWALEGATLRETNVQSVVLRPEQAIPSNRQDGTGRYYDPTDIDQERDLVGFDDELIVVRKMNRSGGESLLIYDFT
ncbi:hypothetical protein B0T21DRAFT_298846 [Apiosordaria backusii]|uniref:F-box domain-containing protein n=1 Tax=Apiosordaria backusii TaxID=314023 RepID=A0AA40DL38_9PEZI|nr:hypothetical protein B0T21DRAFT_298846 [Apiosordaria backusii]